MLGVVPSNSSYLPVGKAENAPEASAQDVEAAVGGRERAVTYSPAAPENTPTVLTFTNIMVCTKTKPKKVLLNNLSGAITGGFWAIMGACGSGKTLLLSTLSLRLDQNILEVKGDIRMNGREFSRHTLKAMSAYVMQEDLLHAELTVEETLNYAARLRMARNTTTEEREGRIAEILSILGIPHTRNTIIGNTVRKGISGGERKRVSIAVELLNYPKLVFLDEPTTGLDSTTSLSVCDALKKLTQKGDCTVICTIHQPQPKIFDLFDNLILLKQGNMVYHGSARKTDRFLQELGMPCPAGLAIADHLIDIISPTDGDEDVVTDTARKYVVPVDLSLGIEKKFFDFDLSKNTWFGQFTILFQRNMQQYLRNSDVIVMNLLVTALLAIFTGAGLWHNIGTGQDSIAKRVPSLFFCCVTQGIICSLQAINSFPVERAIMLRERQAGTYRVSAYFMAKSAVDILAAFWPPIIFSCIVYFMIGYQKRADKFFMFMFFMVLNSLAPSSAATAISCFCGTIDISLVVLSVTLEGCRLFGGFFASPKQFDAIPKWRFADVLSYMKYSFIGVALNELSGLELDCDKAHCAVTSGQQIIDANGYDEYSTGYCIGILFVLIIGSRLLAYLGLRFIKS